LQTNAFFENYGVGVTLPMSIV